MKMKDVSIIITNKCNASCQICCYNCSPNQSEVIEEKLMYRVIDQAKEFGYVESICFTGGEPFLYYDLLKKGLEYAKNSGFKTTVASNGYWGMWPADELYAKFKELPIDLILISTDEYHQEYIPESDIEKAIELLRTLQIGLKVGIGETRLGKSCGEYFKALGSYKYLLSFYTYAFERSGRAEAMSQDDFYFTEKAYIPSELSVRYDGEVFLGDNQLKNKINYSNGNIKCESLIEILSKERS